MPVVDGDDATTTSTETGGGFGGAGGFGGFGGASGFGGEGGQGGEVGVAEMALGGSHTCLRLTNGELYCWGDNSIGQLGLGEGVPDQLVPTRVDLGQRVRHVAAGTSHTCAVLEDAQVVCWGANQSGQLGRGTQTDHESIAAPIVDPPDLADTLSLGERHTCGIFGLTNAAPVLACWGSGSDGQIGSYESSTTPMMVETGVTQVAAGAFHTAFLKDGNQLFGMGTNFDEELGVGGVTSSDVPVRHQLLPDASLIGSGLGHHTCVLARDQVFCYGRNDQAQLGDGHSSVHEAGVPVVGIAGTQVQGIALGFSHSVLLSNGHVYAFGDNFTGQLGLPGPDQKEATFIGLEGVTAIGSGTVHSCAYKSKKEVYCWGANDFGQLGDGTVQKSETPVLVKLPN